MTGTLAAAATPRTPPCPAPRWTRWRPRAGTVLLAGLTTAVLTVQGCNITGYPGLGDDEGTYLAQAWAVQQGRGLAHYTYWYDHPPAGWLQIGALSWLPDRLGGRPVTAHARLIMLAVTTVNVVLLYVLACRLGLTQCTRAAAVLLFGLCPLSVTMQRQIYLDGFAVAWFLGALVLALSPRRHLWHHMAAGACAGIAVLSKETMAVALPALVFALWRGTHPDTRKFSLAGFTSALVLMIFLYPLYAMIKGEFLPGAGHVSLIGAIGFQLHGRSGSGSIFTPGSDAGKLLRAWLYSDRVLLFAGLAATVVALLLTRCDRLASLRSPAAAGGLLTAAALRPGGYLPAMYVLQVLPFYALALAGVAEAAGAWLVGHRLSGLRAEAVGRRVLLGCAGAVAVAVVLPRWYDGDRRAITAHDNTPYVGAARWIRQLPDPAHHRIVVDDTLWLDAVKAGFRPGTGAIWFYKLDPDPAVSRVVTGWRSVDYLVASPIMRLSIRRLPAAKSILDHSRVIQTYGTGDNRVEAREVVR